MSPPGAATVFSSSPVVAGARRAFRRPETWTALAVGGIAVMQARSIWLFRSPGAFAGDESMYSAGALQIHGHLPSLDAVRDVLTMETTGPLVPALSAVLLFVTPTDPRSVLLVQPLLLLFTAVAVTGITRRFAGAWMSAAAGIVFAVTPSAAGASLRYFFGLGVAATMTAAVWALLASDRGGNRFIWCYGLALGLTPLARTMAIAFVPALVAAAALVSWGDERGRRRAALATAGGVMVFAPVFWLNRSTILEYLTVYGYDKSTAVRFPGSPFLRPLNRFDEWRDGIGRPVSVIVLALVALGVANWARRGVDRRHVARHPATAVLVVCVAGYAALLSTANVGDWFDLPLIALSISLVMAAFDRLPRPVGRMAPVLFAPVLVATMGRSWQLLPPGHSAWSSFQGRFGYTEVMSPQEDERLAGIDREVMHVASDEWWTLVQRVDAEMARLRADDPDVRFGFEGSANVLNLHAFALASSLRGGTDQPFDFYDDVAPACHGPSTDDVVILVPVGDSRQPERVKGNAVAERLRRGCWQEVESIPMPRHGDVVFYRRPERDEP